MPTKNLNLNYAGKLFEKKVSPSAPLSKNFHAIQAKRAHLSFRLP
jgi:hypothetical protein